MKQHSKDSLVLASIKLGYCGNTCELQ